MTLRDDVYRQLDQLLAMYDLTHRLARPGERSARQPVHTLYLPADTPLAESGDVIDEVRDTALAAVEDVTAGAMARITGVDAAAVDEVWPRVLTKLRRQPVEDLRLDLEDNYGIRPDAEEDAAARAVGDVLRALAGDGAPVMCGVRVKSLEGQTRRRGVRSLDLVLDALGPVLPPGFVVTLPKVSSPIQVETMAWLCDQLEQAHRLPPATLRFEVQVELPDLVLGPDGTATVARVLQAARGRCVGLHYGTYDYSAALGVAAAHQAMDHPVADHAKDVMQVAAAQTGVRVSDGSTNVLPVGDRDHVERAWALHARLVTRSLQRGIYQGWDLHPAQLPTRYLATFTFFRAGVGVAVERLRRYLDRQAGGVLDEPATAAALSGYLLRGLDCAAVDAAELAAAGAPDVGELRRLARHRPEVWLDGLPREVLREQLHGVCASLRWVSLVASAAPYGDLQTLLAAADAALAAISERDLDEALAGHPRIGERSEHASSRREQAGVGDDVRAALLEGNREYERRFGHVYLVCASGRSGEELLGVLRERLGNEPAQERAVVREELGKINRLRLQRLVEER